MKYKIITNNDGELLTYLKSISLHVETEFIDGNIRDVVFAARDTIAKGYALVADPVAGRLERPTPFLTIILKSDDSFKTMDKDILRIEYFIDSYLSNQTVLENLTEEYKRDFRIIDTSLTKGCCLQMLVGK